MSLREVKEPVCQGDASGSPVELIIEARGRDIDGLPVRRVLPSARRRMVGPYVFFDHMGPADLPPEGGIEVRPHPHINLATVTYLFDGEILHRDSVGSEQLITPGAINWMTAGRGIAHSERSSERSRREGQRLHGIQLWVALPRESEEVEPSFVHHPADTIPATQIEGVELRVMLGEAFGLRSPVELYSPMLYVELNMPAGTRIELPDDLAERAVYLVEGELEIAGESHGEERMLILETQRPVELCARRPSRVLFLAGEPLEGPRHIWWNFVSSSKARIEQAKEDWREGRFGTVVHDEDERIPLPER